MEKSYYAVWTARNGLQDELGLQETGGMIIHGSIKYIRNRMKKYINRFSVGLDDSYTLHVFRESDRELMFYESGFYKNGRLYKKAELIYNV